jgi:hypothetical protein
MKTQFRETMKIHTALSEPEENGPFIWCRFEFDPEFQSNSYEFQHTYVSEIYGAMGELLKELETKAIWQENIEMAESGEELRDVARDMLEKIDDGFFDDDGGEERRKRRKMN